MNDSVSVKTALWHILSGAMTIYMYIVIARVVMTWFRPNPNNPFVRTVCKFVDPVTYRIARIMPTRVGLIDFAPFILVICIYLIKELLSEILL